VNPRILSAFARHHPAIPFAICLMLGIFSATQVRAPLWLGFAVAAFALILLAASLLLRKRSWRLPLALILALGLGFSLMARSNQADPDLLHIVHHADKGKIEVHARVIEPLRYFDDHVLAIVEAERIPLKHGAYMPVSGKISLHISDPRVYFQTGDTIRFESPIRKVTGFSTPGVFDRESFWRRRGVLATAYVRAGSKVTVVSEASNWNLAAHTERTRSSIRDYYRNRLTGKHREVISALVLGDRDRLTKKIRSVFQRAGVSHLLAISGMHVGSIFLIVFLGLSRLFRLSAQLCRRVNIYRLSAGFALIPALLYAQLAGWPISTARAFIMVAVFAGSLIIGRHRDLVSTLSVAAIAILLFAPYSLFEPGFQLSFTAVFGMVTVAPRLITRLRVRDEIERLDPPRFTQRALQWIVIALASSFAAILMTTPITVYHFGAFTPYAMLGNLLMIPLYTLFVVPVALTGTLLIFAVEPLGFWMIIAAERTVELGYLLSELIARIPGTLVHLSRPTWLEIIAFYAAIAAGFAFRKKAGKIVLGLSLAILLLTPAWFELERRLSNSLRLTVIDVGQGLSQLVEFPGGKVWLIDGGGSTNDTFDVGEAVVGPFLRAKRIHTIDRMINTHPHPDHFGGLAYVAENFRVKQAVVSGMQWDEDDRYLRFLALLERNGVSPTIGSAELPDETLGEVKVRWVYPPKATYSEPDEFSVNNRSIVFHLTYEKCSFLLNSDIEREAEDFLVDQGIDLRAETMVAAHHGSRSSSTPAFMASVRPKTVVIPVGAYNWYGHPSDEVLERYKLSGIKVYRTDLHGSVTVECTGDNIEISTFSSTD
jgi:competence protein ComEC